MRTVRSVAELREALAAHRRAGEKIGLVPTMGAFHAGHISLMQRARLNCGVVVVSLFVNPTQFGESADLDGYPRNEARDAAMASAAGVDILFAPPVDEVYPAGFSTTVRISGITAPLEGEHRGSEHFNGVTTVVTKLFNMVGPDVAFFGQKDAQQAIVIKRLVADLDIPVRIEVCPTVREPDGLAMSSRNVRLSAGERERALAISRALEAAASAVTSGIQDAAAVADTARSELTSAGVEVEYFDLVSAETLAPVRRIDGDVLAVVAARVGATRLIDNQLIHARPGNSGGHHNH
jgi:pantoate--beta-alanine ligase